MRPRRSRGATLAAVLVAVVAAVGTAPAPAGADPAAGADTTIRLTELDPWVRSTDLVGVTVRLTGVPEGSRLIPVLHQAVSTRSAFALTRLGENLGGIEAQLREQELDAGASTAAIRFAVGDAGSSADADGTTATPDSDRVDLAGTGVYPLSIAVHDSDGIEVASLVTYLVRLPDAPEGGVTGHEPLRVASELRLQPRPRLDAEGDLVVTDAMVAATGALIDGLDAAPTEVADSFGFAVAPSFVEALVAPDATGEGDDENDGDDGNAERLSTRRVLELAALVEGLPLQAQPWAPLDAAGWLATDELAPLLERSTEIGDVVLADHLHAPTADTTDLGAWDGEPSTALLRWFTSRGASAFLVPDADLEPLDPAAFPRTLAAPFEIDLGEGRSAPAVQLDSGLAGHFEAVDPTLGANHLIADLSVIALDLPAISRGVVVAPPPGWTPSVAFLQAYTSALAGAHPDGSAPLLLPTALAEVVTGTPPARTAGDTATEGPVLRRSLARGGAPDPLVALGREMTTTGARVDALETMVPGGPEHSEAVTRRFRQQMSLAAMPDVDTDRRRDRFAAIRAEVTGIAESVRLPERQTITLTSDTASLPFALRRPADGPTEVLVHIDAPDRLELLDGPTQAVHLEDQTTRFQIRVRSDSPGDTIVRMTVTSPDSELVVGTTEVVVRSTAASGVGLIISFGSLAFLVVWWARDIARTRRRRRARHVPPAELIDID